MGSCCCKSKTAVINPVSKAFTSNNLIFTPFNGDNERKRRTSVVLPNKSTEMGRLNKVGISTTDSLLLINGYEKEHIVSLEEALKPFDGKIAHLSDQIKKAKNECHFPSEHNLTHDESAAIYLYSMRGNDDNVHNHLQRAWDSGDRSQMKPWLKYLKLLKSGFDKLPNSKTDVWQGTHYQKDLEKTLQSSSFPLYTCMGSCLPSVNDIKNHLNEKSGSKMILVSYKYVNGKDITDYTEDHLKAVMLWPGVKINKAKEHDVDARGSLTIHLMGKSSKSYYCVSQLEE